MAEGGRPARTAEEGGRPGEELAGALLAAEQLVAGLQQGVGGVGAAG